MAKKKATKKNNLSFNHKDLKNSFNTLLANIKFASIDKPVKSIVVTSVGMDEGKSTVSANLALAIANSGASVVLVDSDLRKRSLSGMIKCKPKYGVYSLMSGACAIDEAIAKTDFENLYFLDCEADIQNPADFLSSERFAALVDYLYRNYDYVLFDTPPLVSFVDGAVVGSLADATILVVREGKAKRAAVREAVEQLEQAKANLLGTVLSFSSDKSEGYYYYAYYNKEGKRVSKHSHDSGPKTEVVENEQAKANLDTWLNSGATGKATVRHQSMNTTVADEIEVEEVKPKPKKKTVAKLKNEPEPETEVVEEEVIVEAVESPLPEEPKIEVDEQTEEVSEPDVKEDAEPEVEEELESKTEEEIQPEEESVPETEEDPQPEPDLQPTTKLEPLVIEEQPEDEPEPEEYREEEAFDDKPVVGAHAKHAQPLFDIDDDDDEEDDDDDDDPESEEEDSNFVQDYFSRARKKFYGNH